MGETGHHNHDHHHHHQGPTPHAGPPPMAQPLGAARGHVYPPAEQLSQLHFCIHSNPSWRFDSQFRDEVAHKIMVCFNNRCGTMLTSKATAHVPSRSNPGYFDEELWFKSKEARPAAANYYSYQPKGSRTCLEQNKCRLIVERTSKSRSLNNGHAATVLLAFQHYIVMLGSTVLIASTLVPRMGGTHGDKARVIQTLLFMSGLNTLLQTLIGTRLPTVMGPSFAYSISVLYIINDFSDGNYATEHERFLHTIRAVQGSLIVSSIINIILGYGKAWRYFTSYFSPVMLVPVVSLVGLGLFGRGFPQLGNCVEIGLPMLILLIGCQYLKNLHHMARIVLERFALLICVGIVWLLALILTAAGAYNNVKGSTQMSCRTDRSFLLSSAPWIKVPYPFQWGTPIFRASHVFGMMGAALVTSAESTATFYAASRLAGATAPPLHVLDRSIGLQGVGQLFSGIVGALVGTSASVENVGLLGLTHVGSRRVVQISTAFMIFFSIFGKFGAFFASIPLPIFGAIYCVLFGIVAAIGVSFIQFTNTNSMRNIYVLGLTLFLGISIPQYFVMNSDQSGHGLVKTNAGWFNDILNTIFSSSPTVAIIVGTYLDNTLEAKQSRDERGIPWWKPFQKRDGDSRNEEFYSYPVRMHELIPSRFL